VSDLAAFYVMAAKNSASLVAEMVALLACEVPGECKGQK
jgi:hypothetical protein